MKAISMCMIRVILAIALILAAMPLLAADEAYDPLAELSLSELLNMQIDIGSLATRTIFESPSTVSVIDRDMLKRYNFKTVSEALNTIAGFAVYPTYHRRDLPTARGILQSQYANKVLVLINGIPTWNSVTGTASINRVGIHSVERIEVLKGPASVLYGSNAYSGAVNIVLHSPEKENGEVYIGLGSGEAFASGGNYGTSGDDFKIFIAGDLYDENGIDYEWTGHKVENQLATSSFNPYHNTKNASVVLQYQQHSLLFNASSSDEAFFGAGPEWRFGAGRPHYEDSYLLNYTFAKSLSEKINLAVGVNYDWNETDFSRSQDDSIRNVWSGSRINSFIRSDFQISDALDIEVGADYDYRKADESKSYETRTDTTIVELGIADQTVYEYSLFSQLEYKFNSYTTLLGTRMTHNEFYGTDYSSRGTLVWTLSQRNSVKFIAGQSYRAPSLFEIYLYSPGRVVGNPNLEPEKSTSYELAYLTSFNNFFIQALVYYADYENKIRRVVKTGRLLTYANGNDFNAKGVEIEIKYDNPNLFNGFLNYNYISGNDGDDDGIGNYNFKYIPRHSISLGLSKKISGINIAALTNYWTETSGPVEEVDAQYSIDLKLGYSHKLSSQTIHHGLSIQNLTGRDVVFPEYNRRYADLNVIPTEFGYGRRIIYTLTLNF
ncbi:TonB-dependent receptor [Candidatus Parabeggiatoa sp. HSG14]|uniref:TonB-dependent receptor plug domain-containing protein n=1 Tax=Candidatus Parabeggiatoa sp. HSG14 TaxID=3055593 RepID=UPI0025A91DF6|nr:TonB-dependent receptor [Thiotrichales bacterium HSG14]